MFDADRPIVRKEQDRLNRATFAQYLARCILDHQDSQSLVIGLYGGYGSGKTSLLHLMLEEMQFAATNTLDEVKPIILNFSPWSYSGQNQLVYSFFRRLSSTLSAAPYLKNHKKITHLLELYSSFFTHQPVPKALRLKQPFFKKWKKREDALGWESGRDLTQVKAELNELLRQQSHKIIIMIDNISRLYDHEMKQMFQIIKSMGDYENTVYVLALDKEHVVQAINRIDGRGGEALLEKIVQLPFDVPFIAQQDLENILLDKLKLVMPCVAKEDWNSAEWIDVYYSSLRFFFENCRDITRYVNALCFSYPRVKEVVNAVDFFALTVIEVFLPDLYLGIRENKALFTDLVEGVYLSDPEKLHRDLQRCEEIMNRSKRVPKEIVLRLLMYLFPRVRKMYEPNASFYYVPQEMRKNRRINCSDMFEAYFRLSMHPGYISEEEMKAILQLAENEETFTQALTQLNQDNRIIKFLDLLDTTSISKIPMQRIGNIINALCDNGDLFPEEESSPLRFNTPMRIYRIIHQLLGRIEKPEERFSLLQRAILQAKKSLYIIIHEVSQIEAEHRETNLLPVEYREILPEYLQALCQLSVERIQFWVHMGRLMEHPKLLPILFAWKKWGKPEDCYQYVKRMTLEDVGLLAFLCAALKDPIDEALRKYEKTQSWEKSLENITAFIEPRWLEAHAKTLFEDLSFEQLREREQLGLMIFLDLMKTETIKIVPKTA